MRFGLATGLTVVLGSFVVLALVVGGLTVAFQRETTGIKTRYNVSQAERNARFNDPATVLNIASNDANSPFSPALPSDGDHDGDGLLNSEEISIYGTDPLNPDTDGDGVADGIEIKKNGTDPNNPREGGTTIPPVITPPTSQIPPHLNIKKLTKQVKESGGLDYQSYVETTVGATVDFKIEAEFENSGGGSLVVALRDDLPTGLRFIEGRINNTRLTEDWFGIDRTYTLRASQSVAINITFSASPTSAGSFTNRVYAYNTIDLNQADEAFAIVIARDSSTPGGGGSLNFSVIDKQVKGPSDNTFKDATTASIGDRLDFKIVLNLINETADTKNVILTDDMPRELRHISGSGNGDELFTKGYINIEVEPGVQSYEYTFSATVVSDGGGLAVNTAKAYEAKFAPNGATDKTAITIS